MLLIRVGWVCLFGVVVVFHASSIPLFGLCRRLSSCGAGREVLNVFLPLVFWGPVCVGVFVCFSLPLGPFPFLALGEFALCTPPLVPLLFLFLFATYYISLGCLVWSGGGFLWRPCRVGVWFLLIVCPPMC